MKCANHPSTEASSYCGQCGRPLCVECKRDVSGMIYCESCLAARLHSPLPPWGGLGTGTSPGWALALGFIPGVGAIYNGQVVKAFVQVLIFGSLIALGDRVHGGLDTVFGLAAAAFYFYMVIDSYQTARAKSVGKAVPEWFGMSEMKFNAPLGAVVLIALGVLFLLDNLGIAVFSQVSRFWPVLLIVLGLLLLQRRLAEPKPQPPAVPPPAGPPSPGVGTEPGSKEL